MASHLRDILSPTRSRSVGCGSSRTRVDDISNKGGFYRSLSVDNCAGSSCFSCPDLAFVKNESKVAQDGPRHRKLQTSSSLSDGHPPYGVHKTVESYSRYGLTNNSRTSSTTDQSSTSVNNALPIGHLNRKTSSVSSCRSSSEVDNLSCDEELDLSKVIPEIKIDETASESSNSPYKDNNISEIWDYLFIGDVEAANREPLLCRLNIDYLVDISNLSPQQMKKFVKLKDCPCLCSSQMKHTRIRLNILIEDNIDDDVIHYFDEVNNFIEGARKTNHKVLIYCVNGFSISPTFIIQYLMQFQGLTLKQAFSLVAKRHPATQIPTSFQRALVKLERKLRPQSTDSVFEANMQKDPMRYVRTPIAWT